MTADVVIVGGGVVGSSVAWHLREEGFTGRVVVVERDSSYRRASAALTRRASGFGSADISFSPMPPRRRA
jgi:glycine/D-amino acid oxidase-like deaminating enzyme